MDSSGMIEIPAFLYGWYMLVIPNFIQFSYGFLDPTTAVQQRVQQAANDLYPPTSL